MMKGNWIARKVSGLKRRLLSQKLHYQKISYSQSGEDLIVKYIFDVIGISRPSYIDVGAHHPYNFSNTALFYETGSSGINIEPDFSLFQAFRKYRKRDINLNIGIGKEKTVADFYLISASTLNTFSKEEALRYQDEGNYLIKEVVKLPVETLTNVLNMYCKEGFPQFLNIDAEGVDEIIIRSIDYEQNYPVVICVETLSFSTSGKGLKNQELIDYVTDKGYMVYADTHINTIFVRQDRWKKAP
ncbi:FkbM family methyltransferase [Mucilaginibacter calamicampi]|uniref:FkbM family methyltransferase n=1 Tax=Mucilaginibacter calamicampi TaxID=1302352 RepID=A0ABW2YTC3_9SPHI